MKLVKQEWSKDQIVSLEGMWAGGAKTKAIAAALGKTANSVISKVHALELKKRRAGGKQDPRQMARIRTLFDAGLTYEEIGEDVGLKRKTVQKRCAAMGLIRARNQIRSTIVPKPRKAFVPSDAPSPVLDGAGNRLTVMTVRGCRWPHGDPRAHDFHFCGHNQEAGRPYCAYHESVAHPRRPGDGDAPQ